MSFKEHDKRTFIIDSADAYTARQISKREFLRRMGLAGIGFSSLGLAMLGGDRYRAAGAGAGQCHARCSRPARRLRSLLSRSVMGRGLRARLHRSDPAL